MGSLSQERSGGKCCRKGQMSWNRVWIRYILDLQLDSYLGNHGQVGRKHQTPWDGERPWRMELCRWPVMGTAGQGCVQATRQGRVPHELRTSWCVSPVRAHCPALLGLCTFRKGQRGRCLCHFTPLKGQIMSLNSSKGLIFLVSWSE